MAITKLLEEIIEESEKHPVLNVRNRYGESGYIDYITEEEVTSSIMWGIDRYDRRFIVLKLVVGGNFVMQTIFQRFTDNYFYWRGCGHGSPNALLFYSIDNIGEKELTLLLNVMRGETIKITNELHWSREDYLGKDVCLYDEEKWNAVAMIERNWLLCRYDPKYKMCERVLMRNIEDVYAEAGISLD